MGREAVTWAQWPGGEGEVKALLESRELILRGGLRRRWALAVLEGARVEEDALAFTALAEAVAGRTADAAGADMLIVIAGSEAALTGALAAHAALTGRAPVWVVHGKGRGAAFGDAAARALMRAAGFVDNKVAAVSERLSATSGLARRARSGDFTRVGLTSVWDRSVRGIGCWVRRTGVGKMFRRCLSALIASCAFVSVADAAVTYQFSFNNLVGVTGGSGANFGFSLTYPNFVSTTGMQPIAILPTTLGYSVDFAGTNNIGWWGFDDAGTAGLFDFGFSFSSASFLFTPSVAQAGYYAAPGVFAGFVLGNAGGTFSGDAVLTITEAVDTPTPAALALLGLGLAGLAFRRAGTVRR